MKAINNQQLESALLGVRDGDLNQLIVLDTTGLRSAVTMRPLRLKVRPDKKTKVKTMFT
jgi:hypothetical protein